MPFKRKGFGPVAWEPAWKTLSRRLEKAEGTSPSTLLRAFETAQKAFKARLEVLQKLR